MPLRLLTDKQVAEKLAIGVSTVWRDYRAGVLPRARKYGPSTRWVESDIDEFITRLPMDQRAAA